MKTKFLLLATALFCLASCNNAEFDNNVADLGGNSSVTLSGDVYTVEIEEDLQTKVTVSVSVGEERTFHATLKKNGTPVNCSSFDWTYPGTLFTQQAKGSETYKGVTGGYLKVKGAKMGTGAVNATTSKSNTGGVQVTSNDVDCTVTAGLSSITLSLTGANSVVIGNKSSYKVTATYTDNTTKDVTSEATISSSNAVGLSCSGGVISTSKIDGCLGKRSLTASFGGKTSSSVDFTVTTDFDYLKFKLDSDSDEFSDIRDYVINTKQTQYGIQLHCETSARSGRITFTIKEFYLYIKDSYTPYQGNYSFKLGNTEFRAPISTSMSAGESVTIYIYYLGVEVFSQKVTIVTD